MDMMNAAKNERIAVSERPSDRKLGKNQMEFMQLLKSHRSVWHPGSAWVWKAPSETVRLLEALERRGYVDHASDGKWRMTTEGRRALRDALRFG